MENNRVVNYQIAENTDPTYYCVSTCDSNTDIIGFNTSSA
jgi:hypothetical protein